MPYYRDVRWVTLEVRSNFLLSRFTVSEVCRHFSVSGVSSFWSFFSCCLPASTAALSECTLPHEHAQLILNKQLLQLQLQPFYGCLDFVQHNPLSQYQKKHSPTHTYHGHQSSIIPYLLPPSFTIHGMLLVQFTCLTVFFHNLSPSFLWFTSWPGTLNFILHTFLHPIIVIFSQHMPIPLRPVLL